MKSGPPRCFAAGRTSRPSAWNATAALGQTHLGLRFNQGADQGRVMQSGNSEKICHLTAARDAAIFAGAQGVYRLSVQ